MTAATENITVYEPHTHGLPPLRPYLRELWRRRRFAVHLARTDLKAQHYDTVFGQLWSVLNPLLLAGVYFLLLGVIYRGGQRGTAEYLSVLISGIFFYYYTRNCIQAGSRAVVGGEKLILNTAFPRALLPTSSVIGALLMHLPTVLVYLVLHLLLGRPATWTLLLLPVLVGIQTVFNLGCALFASALTVYFRDTSSFLPYLLRIWMYLTPVLYFVEDVPAGLHAVLMLNPLYPLFAALQKVVTGQAPTLLQLGAASLWAVVALVLGALFFLTRERDFAIRF
ncbi:MAG: ABC transporter permease [Actinomycetota bacterium]|nr:ABC transporter permease [Actinomycetota bacterium]